VGCIYEQRGKMKHISFGLRDARYNNKHTLGAEDAADPNILVKPPTCGKLAEPAIKMAK
jgi:hypothetical protein